MEPKPAQPKIAYFSMEIGLNDQIKEFAGGLGILAGDTLKTAADMGVPMAGIGILYKNGYFKQTFDETGIQVELPDIWDYHNILENTGKTISIDLADGPLTAEVWRYTITGSRGHVVPVFFLNTDIDVNSQENRYISYNLYTPFQNTRLRQEILLGIGGVYAMNEMGYQIEKYHLNESHAAFAVLGLQEILGDREKAREKIVFTTHTPAEHGHVIYFKDHLSKFLQTRYIGMLGGDFEGDKLHLTRFCLQNSSYANAVAKKHGEVSNQMFPGFDIDYVTNGIHQTTWVGEYMKELLDKSIQGWRENPQLLSEATNIPNQEIIAAHTLQKMRLIKYIKDHTGEEFNPEVFTIGFARRVDGYKRSGLIFRDLDILKWIAERSGGLQIVMSGKAYYDYGPAEELIAEIRRHSFLDQGKLSIVYLENYGMEISKLMVAGCDIWLNNPIKPLEASGTSGMKAALNGVPNFSTIDGWWVEGWQEGITGWSIGGLTPESNSDSLDSYDLYRKLQDVILPLYNSSGKQDWAKVQKNAIALNANHFNTVRMLGEYLQKAYHLGSS